MTSKQNGPSCYRSENLSSNDDVEIRLELSDDWDGFLSICIKEFHNDYVNEKSYPDPEERHEYLKGYYETKRKTTFRDGLARLALFKVTHSSKPDETKTIGGFVTVFDNDEAENRGNLMTGCKSNETCEQKVGHCYCDVVCDKLVKICSALEKPVWCLNTLVVSKEYRKYFSPIGSLRKGFDAIVREKGYENTSSVVIYWCTWYESLARRYAKAGHRLLCALKEDKFLKENKVQLYIFLDKIEDNAVEYAIEKIFQEM